MTGPDISQVPITYPQSHIRGVPPSSPSIGLRLLGWGAGLLLVAAMAVTPQSGLAFSVRSGIPTTGEMDQQALSWVARTLSRGDSASLTTSPFVEGRFTEWTTWEAPQAEVLVAQVFISPSSLSTIYNATIDWGDGAASTVGATSSTSCFSLGGNGVCVFAVFGSHTYTSSGLHPMQVSVTGGGASTSGEGFAQVAPAAPADTTAYQAYVSNLWNHAPVGVLGWHEGAACSSGPADCVNQWCSGSVVGGSSVVITARHCFWHLGTPDPVTGEVALNGYSNHFEFEPGINWESPCTELTSCGPNQNLVAVAETPRLFVSADAAFVVMGTGSQASEGTAAGLLHFGASTQTSGSCAVSVVGCWGAIGFPVRIDPSNPPGPTSWSYNHCPADPAIVVPNKEYSLNDLVVIPGCDQTPRSHGMSGSPLLTNDAQGFVIGGIESGACGASNPCPAPPAVSPCLGVTVSATSFVCGSYFNPYLMVALVAALQANFPTAAVPLTGDWNVTYGNHAEATITGSDTAGYTITATSPVVLGNNGQPSSSCSLPVGSVLATFGGTASPYSGQHGLWYNNDCSFGTWASATFTLGPAYTLTAILPSYPQFPPIIFNKAI